MTRYITTAQLFVISVPLNDPRSPTYTANVGRTSAAHDATMTILYTSGMKIHLVLVGSIIACCGLFAFSNILQRAQTQLSPEQLAALVAQNQSSWVQFFLPIAPLIVAYLLLPLFPNHQALLAVPALIAAVVLIGLQFVAAGKRVRALDLPVPFMAARRKANVTLLGSFVVAACFYAFAMSL